MSSPLSSSSVAGESSRIEPTCGESPTLSPAAGGRSGASAGVGLRFTIPSLPPSVNSLHQIIYSQRRVELKPEVRRWRSNAKEYVPRVQWSSSSSIIRIDIVVHYRLFTSEGKLREFDTQNLLKPLIDLIAEKQGWNDKRAKAGSWNTVDSGSEKVEVVLREVVNGS